MDEAGAPSRYAVACAPRSTLTGLFMHQQSCALGTFRLSLRRMSLLTRRPLHSCLNRMRPRKVRALRMLLPTSIPDQSLALLS